MKRRNAASMNIVFWALLTYIGCVLPNTMSVASADNLGPGSELPKCEPVPKLLHYEVLEDDRESRVPHQGRVRLGFTIDSKGQVKDVEIIDSTDNWFNDISIQSVARWRYEPPIHPCRTTTVVTFKLKE
jgi:TonB family protein